MKLNKYDKKRIKENPVDFINGKLKFFDYHLRALGYAKDSLKQIEMALNNLSKKDLIYTVSNRLTEYNITNPNFKNKTKKFLSKILIEIYKGNIVGKMEAIKSKIKFNKKVRGNKNGKNNNRHK